jgi:hypothetical protein
MSQYIVLSNELSNQALKSIVEKCSFIDKYLSKEEVDSIIKSTRSENSIFIIFDTGFLINYIKGEASKLICWGKLDGILSVDEAMESGMFFRKETQVIEREGVDPQYDKLLNNLIGDCEGYLESAIWFQHINFSDEYIPEMDFLNIYLRDLKDSGVTDEKDYTIAIKKGEEHYEVSTVVIAYHISGTTARSQTKIELSQEEFLKLVEVINQ